MKRLIALFFIMMAALASGCGKKFADESPRAEPNDIKNAEDRAPGLDGTEFVILSTTDIHGKCWDDNILTDGTEGSHMLKVKTAVSEIRAAYGAENVLLLDNGDLYQGTPVSSVQLNRYSQGLSEEPPAMAVCVADIGYTMAGIGNHEFNYPWKTMEDARAYLREKGVPTVCANLYYESSGENVFTPYLIKDIAVGGKIMKLGILGLASTDCPRWDVPDKYPGILFHHPDNPGYSIAWEAAHYVSAMRKDGCDFIVVVYHGGAGSAEGELVYGKNSADQAARMIAETEGIDMVIAGHDHSAGYSNTLMKNKNGQDVLIVNGGGSQMTKSVFALAAEDSGFRVTLRSSENLVLSGFGSDEALKAKIAPYAAVALENVRLPAGKCVGEWDTETSFYLRQSDSIDLIQAAQIYEATESLAEKYDTAEKRAALFARTGLDHLDVDLSSSSVVVSGDYSVKAGDMTMKDIYRLYRYDNTLYVLPLTGAEIKDILEQNASTRLKATVRNGSVIYSAIGDTYSNPVFGGLSFTYDLYRSEGERVLIDGFSNGRAFETENTYLVAVNNYHLGNTGCGFGNYSPADAVWSQTDDMGGGTVQDLLLDYFTKMTAEKGGVDPADFNWHWKLDYSGDLNEEQPLTGSILAKGVKKLHDGQKILIFYPLEGLVLGTKPAEKLHRLCGVHAAVSGELLGTDAPAAVFTVEEVSATEGEEAYFAFRAQEGYLTSGDAGNSLSFSDTLTGPGIWYLEEVDGGFHIRNKAASYDGKTDQALQWYSGFTTYGVKSTPEYLFELYELN